MDRYFGFDLGDAESAISRLSREGQEVPEMIRICDTESFITAYAMLADGSWRIGEQACYLLKATRRGLRFKSRFLTDPASHGDVRRFAAGVLGELYGSGDLIQHEDCCFYIGCPAGWDGNTREEYRQIFEEIGYPPLRIISESRAAMVSACQSRHLQVGYDILQKPVLVVDIGSSTTDFAYICGGREVEMQTAGEVMLGGGIMDEILLEESVTGAPAAGSIRKVFADSEPWRVYCEFAARKLKEKYFSDEEYWKDKECRETVLIRYGVPLRLPIRMDPEMAERLLTKSSERLSGRSFREVFLESLENVRDQITGAPPELIFLTGGVSRLPAMRDWCSSVFPDAVVIRGSEPEFAVSRGLAYCGRIDEDMREFREELKAMNASRVVEDLVQEHIRDLYRSVIDVLVDPIIEKVAVPVFSRWREGEIRRLADTDEELQKGIEEYLHSEEARDLLVKPIAAWLKPVADGLEEVTMPICARHHVPYTALSLNSYLQASEIDIRIDARKIFALEEFTWFFDSLVSLIVGLLCGGSGIALISSGPAGIIAGAMASFFLLILGKGPMETAFLKADIPVPMRKMTPRHAIENRKESLAGAIRQNFYDSMEEDKNAAITSRMVDEISVQIETCLTRMAEVVEIPLG